MDIGLFWVAIAIYAAASCCFFIWITFSKESWGRAGFNLVLLGLIPHLASIIFRWVNSGHGPYITQYEVFSSNAILILAMYCIFSGPLKNFRIIGAFAVPFAVLLMGYGSLSINASAEAPITFKSGWLIVHITFAKLSGASILLASGLSLFYIIKEKKPDSLSRISDKERLEDLSYRFLALSLLFQSVMIVAGAIWAYGSWGRFWGWDPIETWSLISWLSFGIVLHLRRLHGWRGTKGAYLTIGTFLLSLFAAYFVVFFRESIHSSYLVR